MANNYFKKFSNEGVEFMDGRTAGDIQTLVGETVLIEDYAFIKDSNSDLGKYGVFTVVDIPDQFFFAPSVVTDVLSTVDQDGMKGALCGQQPVKFLRKESRKTKRKYIYMEFVG